MIRATRAALAGLVLAAAISAGELAAPRNVFACSCAATTLADFVGRPESIIVSGTISDLRNDGDQVGLFTVGRIFQGTVVAAHMPIRGGGGGDCTIDLRGVMNAVFVATVDVHGALVPFLCAPFGDLGTPQGRAVLATVVQTLGEGIPPGATDTGTDVDATPTVDLPMVAVLLVAAIVAFVLIASVVVAFRRRESPSEAP